MQISFSHEMLAITIQDNAKVFYHLQNIIERNFSKRIGRKDKTIVFKQEDESVQRRYFLKLISKMYRKSDKFFKESTSAEIENAIDKSIKITHLKSNQLQQQLKITMNIEDNYAIVFNLGSNNSILVTYLKNYFKGHLVKYKLKNHTVTIYPQSQNTFTLLEKIIIQKEIIGCYVNFKYDSNEVLVYKQTLTQKLNKKRKFNALFSLLQEYYEVLGCTYKDDFYEIRKNYIRLVKMYHPDTLANENKPLEAHYIEKFQTIQNAYEMIKVHFDHEKSA